ncbi:translation initiation factor IF-2 [Desulfovibrio litoralis]|uniref:translation initiation factor IF-2 n=1 Tax=Desulfovibrio litoralis TaxID=466107 RepID=UPI003CCC4363
MPEADANKGKVKNNEPAKKDKATAEASKNNSKKAQAKNKIQHAEAKVISKPGEIKPLQNTESSQPEVVASKVESPQTQNKATEPTANHTGEKATDKNFENISANAHDDTHKASVANQASHAEQKDETHNRPKKANKPEISTPTVKVISRPQAQDTQASAPASASGNRQGGENNRSQHHSGNRPGYDNAGRGRQNNNQGERPQRNSSDRPSGDRPYRPAGDRPAGDRPYRPAGDRPAGDRPYRPAGDRPAGDRPFRPAGDRPAGDRPAGDRPSGDRPFRPAGDRPFRPAGDRPAGAYTPRPAGAGGYTPRPAGGYAPRPGGFVDKDKDADSRDNRQRPGGTRPGVSRPGGSRPNSAPFAPAVGADIENKKRRNKDKRTVDFSEEFGRKKKHMDGDDSALNHLGRRQKNKRREIKPVSTQPLKAVKRKIKVDEFIRVSDLAHQMGLKAGEIIKILFGLGVMATINQTLDIETATVVAAEFGYEVEKVGYSEDILLVDESAENPEDFQQRPPVITIMGHVDHGKTSLLDAIRKETVAAGEAGGITQHIGAYHVKTKKGEIVFLDTPGHEAFTSMRARGAQITDIVVLVVAADDGVMEQTREAVNHAKAANVPIMVAVNKMDKETADPDRIKRELSELELVPEDWGGTTTYSYVSAKTRQGLDDFMELLALQAEIMELKANPNKLARGHIVEARLDKGRGALGTVLIQQGTLKVGDTFVCGVLSGKVRAMFDDKGKAIKEAGPSTPVVVQGFDGVPEAGEEFVCLTDEKLARRIAETRGNKQREKDLAKESKVTLETFLARRPDEVEALSLNLVVKADVHGSLEAITDALLKLATAKVKVQVIHSGTGAITESDIMLAAASSAIIIGFNVRPTAKIKEVAENENVEIRFYDIIYKLVEEVRSAMEGMLAPVSKEVYLGQAEVRQTFSLPKAGVVAGCFVIDGKITRNAGIRLLRDGIVVHTGKISSLKRFKDDVREVLKGYECGISIENFNDIKASDVIEAFETVEEAAKL